MALVVVLSYYVCYRRDNPTHPRRNFHLLNNFLLTTSDLRADEVDISMKQIESYLLDSPSKKKTRCQGVFVMLWIGFPVFFFLFFFLFVINYI